MDLLDLHRRAMRHSVEIVNHVRDDQWGRPTPCTQWTLRELLVHMISENNGFAAAAAGETSDRSVWNAPTIGDIRADYAASADRVVTAFTADGVLDGSFWLPGITDKMLFPAPKAISFHFIDYVVHGWDVAASIGYPVPFEDDLLAAVLEVTIREVPDGPRRRRPDASFRPPLPVPADAPTLHRLLATLGRSPTWPD